MMPTVGKGDNAAEFPYTKEGMEAAEDYAQQTNQEIEIKNAPDMRETYHMGGQVPGQPGFGERPGQMGNMMKNQGNQGDQIASHGYSWIEDLVPKKQEMQFRPQYKKGGKVKKY
jgi:hypothetical protein